jgi:dimethylargininase
MRALIRGVPASFANALSSSPPPVPIDVALARAQHAAYRAALEACGAQVHELPADDRYPDCCFVEDTAVVAAGAALVPRLGAQSRRGEIDAVAAALAADVEVFHMDAPATLDGGDCMRVGGTIYAGRSARTNAAGIARLAEVFEPRGLRVVAIEMPAHVLHLKCVCSPLGDDRILLADESIPRARFEAGVIAVPVAETYAANAVAIGNHVVIADGFPRTREAIERAGYVTHAVPTSEVRKADGSLTCQSILLG